MKSDPTVKTAAPETSYFARFKAVLTSLSINIGARKLVGCMFAAHWVRKLFSGGSVKERVNASTAAAQLAEKDVVSIEYSST